MATRLTRDYFTWGESPRSRVIFTIERVLDFAFSLLYSLLGIRLLLDFFNASKGAGFYGLVRDLTQPFYGPFEGLFRSSTIDGHPIVWPIVAAIVAYMFLHGVIRGILHLVRRN